MSCPSCEWCWGADGQDLKPLVPRWAQCRQCAGRIFQFGWWIHMHREDDDHDPVGPA